MSIGIYAGEVDKFDKNSRTTNTTTPQTVRTPMSTTQSDIESKKARAKETAKENLEARVTELLDLKDNFLQANIINSNGTVYLRLSRPQNDKSRPNERHDFSMSAIKSKLGVKDGVIKQNNNLSDITGRKLQEESGSATLEPGKSLLIPLGELGQDFSWYQFSRNDLTDYVNAYLNCK